MRNGKELLMERLLQCLENSKLSQAQLEQCRQYLMGEMGQCDLGIKKYMNPDMEPEIAACFTKLVQHKETELVGRFFDLIYQMYGPAMGRKIPYWSYVEAYVDPARNVAIAAENATRGYFIHASAFQSVRKITSDGDVLCRAIEECDHTYCNAELAILTALFIEEDNVKRYPKQFERYTNLMVHIVGSLFAKSIPEADEELLRKYIRKDRLFRTAHKKEVEGIMARNAFGQNLPKLLIGSAAVNYRESPLLLGFLKVCVMGGHTVETLDIVRSAYLGLTVEQADAAYLSRKALEWYEDLEIATTAFIRWLAGQNMKHALAHFAVEKPKDYIRAMQESDLREYGNLSTVLKEQVEQTIYDKHYRQVLENGQTQMREKLVDDIGYREELGKNPTVFAAIREYLLGTRPIEDLYPYQQVMAAAKVNWQVATGYPTSMNNYRKAYGEDDFYGRCMTVLALRECIPALYHFMCETRTVDADTVGKQFASFARGGLPIGHQLDTALKVYDYAYSTKEELLGAFVGIFSAYLKENAEETLAAFSQAGAIGRVLAVRVLEKQGQSYRKELFAYFGDGSKQVREEMAKALGAHEEWSGDVIERLASKKAPERELAVTVIGHYMAQQGGEHSGRDYEAILRDALEKEKNKKVAAMLAQLLHEEIAEEQKPDTQTAESYIREQLKGGRKNSLSWLFAAPFAPVHKRAQTGEDGNPVAGEEVSQEYLQAIAASYSGMNPPGINREVTILTEALEPGDLHRFAGEVFDRWLEAGAEARKKWVLYLAAICGGTEIVARLTGQINEWAANARGAIAAEAVRALALNDSPIALLTVDNIARKYKFRQVKTAAGEALRFAAEQLGLTVEELADRIVPDLGFDEHMERRFDYGTRSFTVTITPALEIEVFDEDGKRLKNLPAPGKRDDERTAGEAYAEFKEMKKQMKAAVRNQQQRLELALALNRRWSKENWERLFVKNPIMHQFAISLIWGYYENGECKQTFRYMEDGSFNTVDEEEYELGTQGEIGLMHPIELSREEMDAWKEQLSDYEIVQSIEQLNRPVFTLNEEEKKTRRLERFGGVVLNGLSLAGKLVGLGWYKGPALDGGIYEVFYREDADCGLGCELHFSGSYIGGENEDVTVYEVMFYTLGTVERKSYSYDEVKEEHAAMLCDVPPRYFSEIVYQLTKATASSEERVENWKAK